MSKFFNRVGTKIGGAIGKVQRTEYDSKIRDGIQHYTQSKEQTHKIVEDVKGTLPNVGGMTKTEKLSQTLRQTANMYGSSPAAPSYTALADALQQFGREERVMDRTVREQCNAQLEAFVSQKFPAFKTETKKLETACLDMDSAKNKNQKSNSAENQQKETETTEIFVQQTAAVEALIDDLPNQHEIHRQCLKAYATSLAELYKKGAELMENTANNM